MPRKTEHLRVMMIVGVAPLLPPHCLLQLYSMLKFLGGGTWLNKTSPLAAVRFFPPIIITI